MRISLIAALSVALALPQPTAAQAFLGPLHTEEVAPLQRLGFPHAVEGADLLAKGSGQIESWIGYSSIFSEDSTATHQLFLDMERLDTNLTVRGGLTTRLELGARVSLETTGGGILDGFISGWHQKLGLPNADRAKYPSGVYAARLKLSGRAVALELPKRTLAVEDVRVYAKWLAWRSPDGRRLMSLRLAGRMPMQADLVGSERADASLAALARVSWSRWHLHGTVGGATVNAVQNHRSVVVPAELFGDLAVERSLTPQLSAVVQTSFESPRLHGFGDATIDGWPINLAFGLTSRLARGWRMDVSFQEDVPPDTPAADFTLGIGIRRGW